MSEKLISMTRKVAFSAGHRYWLEGRSADENRALYGKWASPFNHGHNYVLDVTVRGSVDPKTGMVVNIKRIDDVLKARILAQADQKSLNDEVLSLKGQSTTLENVLNWIWAELTEPGVLPSECELTAIRLEEMPTLYGEKTMNSLTITRTYEFAASHRLHSPNLSDQENLDIFGKCNNEAGHGHNYVLEVTVSGPVNPVTGMSVDLTSLDDKVNALVVDRYDHKNFNVDIPEFEGRPTSSEIVVAEIFERLNGQLPAKLERVRLFETARNMFEATA